MWAVLCNRRELARLLWQWTPNSIACALMASKLLQSLADYAVDNKELSDMVDDLLDHSRCVSICFAVLSSPPEFLFLKQ